MPSHDTHYICRRESSKENRKWVPKEDAIMKGKIPYCPDCGRKLSTRPLKRKYKDKAPYEIVKERNDMSPLNLRANRKCPHCKTEMRRMRKMEKKGRMGVFQCPKCKCIFCWTTVLAKKLFVIARKHPKCPTLKADIPKCPDCGSKNVKHVRGRWYSCQEENCKRIWKKRRRRNNEM